MGYSELKEKYFLFIKTLIEKHNGKVPKTFEDLELLPGVGHKTASVVMSQGFGYPAFPVDTDIHRLAQRWGLTNGKRYSNRKRFKKIISKNIGTGYIFK